MARKATAPVEPVDNGRDEKGKFTSSNKGRPRGSKNKRTTIQVQAAMEYFEELIEPSKAIIKAHLEYHKDGKTDCGACTRYITLVYNYYFGKPTQPIEFDVEATRRRIADMAERFGLTEEELLRRAERIGLPMIANGKRIAS